MLLLFKSMFIGEGYSVVVVQVSVFINERYYSVAFVQVSEFIGE